MIGSGVSPPATIGLLRAVMQACIIKRDGRWRDRFDDIDRTVESAVAKYAPPVQEHLNGQRVRPLGTVCRARISTRGAAANGAGIRGRAGRGARLRHGVDGDDDIRRVQWRARPPLHSQDDAARQLVRPPTPMAATLRRSIKKEDTTDRRGHVAAGATSETICRPNTNW